MIPSLNDQSLTPESWDFEKTFNKKWVCDCCMKPGLRLEIAAPGSRLTPPYEVLVKPTFVKVSGINYHACDTDCARILFSIHHQYAMREIPAENRFVHLEDEFAGEPNILDLDTVSQMAIERHGNLADPPSVDEWISLTYWMDNPRNKFYAGMSRKRAHEIMELWKKRPAKSLLDSAQKAR